MSKISPFDIIIFASLPALIVPVISSIPKILALLDVINFKASSLLKP